MALVEGRKTYLIDLDRYQKKSLLWFSALIAAYFWISWFFPWEKLHRQYGFWLSYLFDVCIISVLALWQKIALPFRITRYHPLLFLLALGIIGYAIAVTFFIQVLGLKNPIDIRSDTVVFLLLVLAPLVEEFLYRFAIYGWLEKMHLSPQSVIFISSLAFALSHFSALWALPAQFKGFVFYQVVYTFGLGVLCGVARRFSGSIWIAIAYHALFNLTYFFIYVS